MVRMEGLAAITTAQRRKIRMPAPLNAPYHKPSDDCTVGTDIRRTI